MGLLIGIFLINLANAGFNLAPENKSYDITTVYAPSESLKGWINISFQNEPANSLLTAFESSISLKDFLYNNSIDCESSSICYCFPSDCENNYISSNGKTTKNFSLAYTEEKIISFLVEGNINSISEFEFNISVINNPGCLNPLRIDILNDGLIEWSSKKHNTEFVCTYSGGMGCFNSGSTLSSAIIDNAKPYCEKIGLVEGNNFSIGSWIKKGSTAWSNGLLEMSLYDLYGNLLGSCNLPEPSTLGGEISCSVDYNNLKLQDYYVCVQATSNVEGYETKKESINSCGFYAVPGEETEYHDYYIFAKASKFDYIGKFKFNQDEYEKQNNAGTLSEYVNDYISQKYRGNCGNGCSIPIKFRSYSNLDLNIEVSDVKIKYSTGSGPSITNLIYDTNLEEAKITSNFSRLDLAKANLFAPSSYGNETLSLELNGNTILEKSIRILAVPKITNIIPNEVPALVSYPFVVFLDAETSNLTYAWDFGDNTTKQTTSKKILEHAYSSLGDYSLTVTVSNKYGNSSKTINVKVSSPKNYINSTINDYEKKLEGIQAEINKLPEWIKKEILKQYDIDNAKSQLNSQKSKYDSALSDEDYIEIMEALVALNIPDSFNLSQKITPSEVFPDPGQINLDALEYLGAGRPGGTEEEYTNAVTYWFINALQVKIESKTYALYYKDEVKDLLSYTRVTLTPKENQKPGVVYFLVNGNPDKIKFNTDKTVKEYDDASAVIFSKLEGQETLEFLYPGKISLGNFPFYISPEFKNLEIQLVPGICNFNKKCEKDLGEDYKNCRSDCKPIGLTILWICILLFFAFCIYIALQEWYKRHYERHLFPDKNPLFNLINFMNISNNQGMKKSDILEKLKNLGWSGEQLRYAWNKFQGKRTGMWEIPVFKWIEKRQVRKELEKRRSLSKPPMQGFRPEFRQV